MKDRNRKFLFSAGSAENVQAVTPAAAPVTISVPAVAEPVIVSAGISNVIGYTQGPSGMLPVFGSAPAVPAPVPAAVIPVPAAVPTEAWTAAIEQRMTELADRLVPATVVDPTNVNNAATVAAANLGLVTAPVAAGHGVIVTRDVQDKLPKGYGFARVMAATGAAAWNSRQGNSQTSLQWLKKRYGESDRTVKRYEFALTTKGPGEEGGLLVSTEDSGEFNELLRDELILSQLGLVEVTTAAGALKFQGLSKGSNGQWVGEKKKISEEVKEVEDKFANPRKVASIFAMSTEWANKAGQFEPLMLADTVAALSERQNEAFLIGPGTVHTPFGLLQVAENTAAGGTKFTSTGTTIAQVQADLRKAITTVRRNKHSIRKGHWIFGINAEAFLRDTLGSTSEQLVWGREMESGKLKGFPFISTGLIPDDRGGADQEIAFFIDSSQIVWVNFGSLRVTSTADGTYDDADGNTVSAFSNDLIAIRVIQEVDFVFRRPESIVAIDETTWK